MKQRMLPTAVVLGLLLLLAVGCTSVQSREELAPDDRWSYTIRELPGRGERLRGELTFRKRRMPLYFSEVVVGSRRFTVVLETTGEGFEGYLEDSQFSPPQTVSGGAPLGSSDRARGWYAAPLEQRRPGTPAEWIWVRRENLSAYLNPQRIDAFARNYQLAQMHEPREPRFRFMFSYGYQSR